jgi:DNA-binding XRE family transcriptional regulator
MMKNLIYGLADSRNELIYYVGKTSVGEKRPLSHLINSHSPEVNEWVSKVREDWGNVIVMVIEEVNDLNFLAEREKYWIGYYSDINNELLNKKDYPTITEYYTDEDVIKFNGLVSSLLFAGDIVKKKRLSLNLTQGELAKHADLNRSSITKVENSNDITMNSLEKILLALTKLGMDEKFKTQHITERARK